MAFHSILATEVKAMSRALGDSVKYVDVDWEVIPSNSKYPSVCRDERAILNAYKIWLQSGAFDYIRNPNFGGFFDNALNDRFQFSPDNEEAVASALAAETATKWPDINLVVVKVKCIYNDRRWEVRVVVQDKKSGAISAEMLSGDVPGVTISVNN
jgi:hypothetical protein